MKNKKNGLEILADRYLSTQNAVLICLPSSEKGGFTHGKRTDGR